MLAVVRIALQRPYTFVVMGMLIAIFGVLAWFRTPTDIFPNIGIPVVSVVWTYNGLPPDDMSGRIVYYYERTITAQVNDIEHVESQSLPGYGVVKVFFQPNVKIDMALAQITAASQTVLKFLPAGVTPPYVLSFNASTVPVLQLAVSSKTLSEAELFDYAQNFIRPKLATVAGAAIPSPYGGKVRQVQIDIDQRKLRKYGLSAQDVSEALAQQNLITPVGTQKIGELEYILSLNNSPTEIAELNDLPIKKAEGAIVYMRDVSYVHDSYPPQTNMVRVDGANSVLMTILKTGSASTLDVIAGVKGLLPKIKAGLPPELRLDAVGDQSPFVQAAVTNVIREAMIAAGLTALMILLFLGSWRSTLIITISIPLAILTAITVLSVMGETINVMTLGGLALAVGILVDDATVTIENVDRHLEHGEEIVTAILTGAQEIMIPATVSLFCISIVFVPIFTLGGVAGFLFRPLAEAVISSLAASYILTYTLVPTLARYLLASQAQPAHGEAAPPSANPFVKFQRGFMARFERFRLRYRDLLVLALARPIRFVTTFLAVVVVSFALAPFLGQNFFPSVRGTQVKLHVRAPIGTRIEQTGLLCDKVEAAIRGIVGAEGIESIVDNVGLPVSGINIAYGNSGTIGVGDADLLITLKADREEESDAYIAAMREQLPKLFPGTSFAFLPADIVTQILNFGLPSPIDVQVIGNKLAGNRAYAEKIFKQIARVPGIADARIQQSFNAPTIAVDADRSRALDVGLTEKDVTVAMQDTFAGSFQTAPTFWLNPKNGVSYPIVVQTPQYWVETIESLNDMPLTARGEFQLLGGLANIRRVGSSAVVSHYDVQPVIDIFASTQDRDLGAIAHDVNAILANADREAPAGSTVVLRGQVATMTSAYAQLFFGLALAVVLIYLLIVVNFQSWLDPFVIISALPTALAGIVWMLFLTFTTLSVPALTGATMCLGVATANSILVVAFAREKLAEGLDPTSAALEAGFTRFRPVLMTALAMILGMIPMAISAEQNAPLGRAVIGGLFCATIATLIFVPVVFSIVHTPRRRAAPPSSH
jgi:multidrug efflux pump subunit AcrB